MAVSHRTLVVALVAAAGLAACGSKHDAAPKAVAPPTVQALMDGKIDPSADAIWESVGTVETAQGSVPRGPKTDAEWDAIEARAQALFEGSALLAQARSAGGSTHSPLADADTPGIRTPEQITADINADPRKFAAAAGRLNTAAKEALDAIKGRDTAALLEAGAHMDAACEACHAAYWYPRSAPLTLPDDKTFARQATNRSE